MDNKEFTEQASSVRSGALSLARRMGLPQEEAEDIAQDTLLRLWTVRERIDGTRFPSLAMTVARNLAIDFRRHLSRHQAPPLAEDTPATGTDDPQRLMEEAENDRRFRSAAARIPKSCRAVLLMRQRDGMETKDIALALGTTPSSVRGLLSRARKLMLEQLREARP